MGMNGFAIPTHPVTGKSKRKPASPRGKNIVPKLKYAPAPIRNGLYDPCLEFLNEDIIQ